MQSIDDAPPIAQREGPSAKNSMAFLLSLFGGVGILILAVWPGIVDASTSLICLGPLLFGCWFLPVVGLACRDLARTPPTWSGRRWAIWSLAVVFTAVGLVASHVPQRIALLFSISALTEWVESAPANEFRGVELNRRFGLYHVDRYGADARGGVFFRTGTGGDGLIGPDQMSYGFAFRPNSEGTPFGNAGYVSLHLFGDWYVFSASDDW
jgi:hypothetical protein